MRTRPFVIIGALAALLLVPVGSSAAAPVQSSAAASPAAAFTATISARANQKLRAVPVKVGALNVPSGKTVLGYYLSESGAPNPTAATSGWRTLPSSFTVSAVDGPHTIYVWARVKGAVSVRGSVSITLDRVAPTASLTITTSSPTTAPRPARPSMSRRARIRARARRSPGTRSSWAPLRPPSARRGR
jgi:hypothetical protein